MVRYDFRHGPRLGVKPKTDHHGTKRDRLFWNKFKNAGSLGWCQVHVGKDVPGTQYALWEDPDDGERYDIVVCDACAKHCEHVHNVT